MKTSRIRILSILMVAILFAAMMPGLNGAAYAEESFTVTFDANGGNAIPPQTVAKGDKAVEPEEVYNGDMFFLGWFENPTYENIVNEETESLGIFDFDSPIEKDITLTALWVTYGTIDTEGNGKVDWAEEGDTPIMDDVEPNQMGVLVGIIGILDKFVINAEPEEGYVFKEWKYADTNETYSTDSMTTLNLNGKIKLIAVFEKEETCTVKFNSNGGTDVDSQEVIKGQKAVKPEDPKNNSGAKFLGWFVKPTIDNLINMETYEPNKFNFDTPITEDTELTGVWVAPVTINIEGDGRIDLVDKGETPELDGEYPYQSNQTNAVLGIWDTFVIGAKADKGYVFKEWLNADTGTTFSKERITDLIVEFPLNLVAVFEKDKEPAATDDTDNKSDSKTDTKTDGKTDDKTDAKTDTKAASNTSTKSTAKASTNTTANSTASATSSTAKNAPKTGDANEIILWVVIAGIAALAIVTRLEKE